ncbi:MAG: PA14 domain-containing protein [Saprospiraceae bacterium]
MKNCVIICLVIFWSPSLFSQCVGTAGQVSWHYWEDIRMYYDFETQLDFLFQDDTYPNGPDLIRKLNSISTPSNYNNQYAAITKGFISVPISGSTTFNLTGNDYVVFLLSTDASRSNLDTLAYVIDNSGREEYNKYPAQTSSAINLNTGQYYYFEIHHKERSGQDFTTLRWQRPYVSDSTWAIISSPFLNDICDPVCPPKGTVCNDGNTGTTDDKEDGNCHCIGTPDTTGLDVGERAVLDAYFYYNTGNGNINELILPKFPSVPDRLVKQRRGLYIQWGSDVDNYASYIQGYFTVPVTGTYDFNLTGVRNVEFRFNSAGSSPSPNQTISSRWGTGRAEHNDNTSQTLTNVNLTANTFYYFETVQAVVSWGDHLNVFWKVPGHPDSEWHMIPELYLYDYTNESACLPQGTPCDDGDPFTSNDMINASCDCIGTPCTPFVDCDDPAADLIEYDYCDISNALGNRADNAWLSCNASANPFVAARSGNHWIHYDLGQVYILKQSRVWNYNVNGSENLGFQNVVVDYSKDGTNWTQLGIYSWNTANGDNTYTGFDGPDFGSKTARYIMITSTDGGPCRGISKVTFTVEQCNEEGTSCNDGDMATLNDHFDKNCNCVGYTLADLDCGTDTLFINEIDLPANTYHAVMALMSGGTILNTTNINFKAGAEIIFEAGFEIDLGSTLEADIEDCTNPVIAMVPTKSIADNLTEKIRQEESLKVYSIQGSPIQTIRIYLPNATQVSLEILDTNRHVVMPFTSHYYPNHGDHYKRIQTRKLAAGVYLIKMTTDSGEYLDKMVVT